MHVKLNMDRFSYSTEAKFCSIVCGGRSLPRLTWHLCERALKQLQNNITDDTPRFTLPRLNKSVSFPNVIN